jgi:hypothetical protein
VHHQTGSRRCSKGREGGVHNIRDRVCLVRFRELRGRTYEQVLVPAICREGRLVHLEERTRGRSRRALDGTNWGGLSPREGGGERYTIRERIRRKASTEDGGSGGGALDVVLWRRIMIHKR